MHDTNLQLRATYDAASDAAYIYLARIDMGGVADTVPVDPRAVRGMINLDFDDTGRLVGIEILDASAKLPPAVLAAFTSATDA